MQITTNYFNKKFLTEAGSTLTMLEVRIIGVRCLVLVDIT